MQRKVLAVGNSKGVSIPAEYLARLELAVGSEVSITLDEPHGRILIQPLRRPRTPKGLNRNFVNQVNEFIERYRPALEELAKK